MMQRNAEFDQQDQGRPGMLLRDLAQDARIAFRTLMRRPVVAIVPVLSSGLGIAACSLIVALANVALFRPLPVEDSVRLMSIAAQDVKTGETGGAISYPDYRDIAGARSFQDTTAYFPMVPVSLGREGAEARRQWGTLATASYFDVVRPGWFLGRGFDPARDNAPGAAPVIVLSYDLWQSRFGGDPGLVGRRILVNGLPTTVIGVTRRGFRGTEVAMVSDFWLPWSMRGLVTSLLPQAKLDIFSDRDAKWLFVAGRLGPNVDRARADAEMQVLARGLAVSYPATNKDRSFRVDRAGQLVPAVRQAMLVFFLLLLTMSALVLLTACANVANLLLARATARQKEMATRRAVGAGGGRLIRQLLTESVLLALMGGALGYAIASFGAHYFGGLRLPIGLPVDFTVSLDYRVLLFCTGLSLVTGMVFGLAPALQAIRPNLVDTLKDKPVTLGRARWWTLRNVLMVGQVATCMVLLVCSGLFLRTLSSSRSADTGMSHRNVLLAGFEPTGQGSATERKHYLDSILRHVGQVPGVESAAITTTVPLSLAGVSGKIAAEGRPDAKSDGVDSDIYDVSPRFFETIGIPVLSGEVFRPGDSNADVAILNRAAAERLFPGTDPIGRRVQDDGGRKLRVVAVVATSKSRMMVERPRPCLYRPISGAESHSLTGITLLVRTNGNPSEYTQLVSAAVRDVDRGLALFDVRTMSRHLEDALLLQRAAAFLFGLAGIVGLVIAGTGIYGLISFLVARQTKEIGIRMAIGATRGQIVGGVLRRGLGLTAVGLMLGLSIAAMVTRGVASLLYGVSPTDPVTFGAVAGFLLLVAMAACGVPALRATRIAPSIAIRLD